MSEFRLAIVNPNSPAYPDAMTLERLLAELFGVSSDFARSFLYIGQPLGETIQVIQTLGSVPLPILVAEDGVRLDGKLGVHGADPIDQPTTSLVPHVPGTFDSTAQAQLQFLVDAFQAHGLARFSVLTPQRNIPYEDLFGSPPHPYYMAANGLDPAIAYWADNVVLPQHLATIPLERSTTRYVATNGNDSNAGTIDAPWQTLDKVNDAIANGTDLRIRFRRGDVWRGEPVLTIESELITVDNYGSGARPLLTGFTLVYNGGWANVSGNTWSRSEATTVGWVRRQSEQSGISLDPLKEEEDAAACQAFAKSWYYNAGTDTLYVNTGGPNPNITTYEAVPLGTGGVAISGDNVRIEGIDVHGAGIAANGVAYGLQVFHGVNDAVHECVLVDMDVLYTGYHSVGHIVSNRNRLTCLRVRAGYCTNQGYNGDPGSGDTTVFVTYGGAGDSEFTMVDCRLAGGTLPSWNWDAQVGDQHGLSLLSHSNDNLVYQAALIVAVRTVYEENPYQSNTGISVSGPISGSDLVTDVRAFIVDESTTWPGQPGGQPATGNKDRIYINCGYTYNYDASYFADVVAYVFAGTNESPLRGFMLNTTIGVNVVSGDEPATAAVIYLNNGGSLPLDVIAENCRLEVSGLSRLSSSSYTWATGSRCRHRNCEFSINGDGESWNYSTFGAAIPDDAYSNCAYAHPQDLSGYVGTYFPDDEAAVIYPLGDTIPDTAPDSEDPRWGTGMDNGLEFDRQHSPRNDNRFDIGPLAGTT